jgi:hypothetical protein
MLEQNDHCINKSCPPSSFIEIQFGKMEKDSAAHKTCCEQCADSCCLLKEYQQGSDEFKNPG